MIISMWRLSRNTIGISCFYNLEFQNDWRAADWWRYVFALSATAMALDKNADILRSPVAHGGKYDTMYANIGYVYEIILLMNIVG